MTPQHVPGCAQVVLRARRRDGSHVVQVIERKSRVQFVCVSAVRFSCRELAIVLEVASVPGPGRIAPAEAIREFAPADHLPDNAFNRFNRRAAFVYSRQCRVDYFARVQKLHLQRCRKV